MLRWLLADAWPKVRLGEIVRQEREQVGAFDGDGLPVLGVTNVEGVTQTGVEASADKSKYLRLRPGRFVYNPYRINVGSIGLCSENQNGICSPAYVVFVPTERVEARLLVFFFKSAHANQLINFHGNRGSVRSALRFAELAQIEIPLPPITEQRRIVARIEELAAEIVTARELRAEAVDEAEAVMGAQAGVLFREAVAIDHVNIDSAVRLERGKFSHRPRNEPRFFGGNHPWIQIGEIESADKYIQAWSETLNDDGLAISKKFPRGTILISIAATIGAVGILNFDCCVPDSIVGMTPREGYESEFVYYYLQFLREHLESVAPRSAQKNINLQILSKLPFPRMSVADQRRIVAELDALQAQVAALKAAQAEASVELNALLPSILDRAFKGEL